MYYQLFLKGRTMNNNEDLINKIKTLLNTNKSNIKSMMLSLESCINKLNDLQRTSYNLNDCINHSNSLEARMKFHRFELETIDDILKDSECNINDALKFDKIFEVYCNLNINKTLTQSENCINIVYSFIINEIKTLPIIYYPVLPKAQDSNAGINVKSKYVLEVMNPYINAAVKILNMVEPVIKECQEAVKTKSANYENLDFNDPKLLIKSDDLAELLSNLITEIDLLSENERRIRNLLKKLIDHKKNIEHKTQDLYISLEKKGDTVSYVEYFNIINDCNSLEQAIRMCRMICDSGTNKRIEAFYILDKGNNKISKLH